MKIVFFGSSQFAVPSLEALISGGHKISCVVTQPDKQKGRGLQLGGTAVKNEAIKSKLLTYQPASINTDTSCDYLASLKADLFIVISYGQILSENILKQASQFAVNIHASILPKYRGAAPINWAIINGEKVTGVTAIKMTKEMDSGPVILKKEINIEDEDTATTLEKKLSILGSELIIEVLNLINLKKITLIPQAGQESSYAPKLKKDDGLILWDRPAQEINNLVRGCLDWPGAFTYCRGKLLKIYKSRIFSSGETSTYACGEIVRASKEGIIVSTTKDSLIIEELQLEGKRRMTAKDFLAGHKITTGEQLGKK